MNKELFRFSTTVEVRWRDLDAMNHVNNAVYFTYMEQARVHYLRDLDLVPDVPTEIGIILAEARCQFKSPLRLRECVTIHVRVSDIGRSSFKFQYCMEGEDGRLVAEAETAQVRYDYENERPIPLSEAWRQTVMSFEPALSPQPREPS